MDWKKVVYIAGVTAGVFIGMKYLFPVMLPFLFGWMFARAVEPLADCLAEKKLCRRLHFSKSGIGAGIILILTVSFVGCILLAAEYVTGRIGDCLKYYPVIRIEAGRILEKCCVGTEHMTGIPAEESRAYLYEQLNRAGEYFWADGRGMNRAVCSVKGCIVAVGMIIVAVVSSILFLQEQEKIHAFVERRYYCRRVRDVYRELLKGAKAYLKAQIRIMGIVCGLCVAGLWVLRVKHFFSIGLLTGILDALPVLGTGTVLVPGGIIFLLRGNTGMGAGFFVLYLITSGARQLLEPRLIGTHVGASPLVVLFCVYMGIIVYGAFGFILGPLSGLLLYAIFKEGKQERQQI